MLSSCRTQCSSTTYAIVDCDFILLLLSLSSSTTKYITIHHCNHCRWMWRTCYVESNWISALAVVGFALHALRFKLQNRTYQSLIKICGNKLHSSNVRPTLRNIKTIEWKTKTQRECEQETFRLETFSLIIPHHRRFHHRTHAYCSNGTYCWPVVNTAIGKDLCLTQRDNCVNWMFVNAAFNSTLDCH